MTSSRGFFGERASLNAKPSPCLTRPCWPEVGSSMKLRASDEGGRDGIGLLAPTHGPFPTSAGHLWVEDFTDSNGTPSVRLGPPEVPTVLWLECDQGDTGSKLRHA